MIKCGERQATTAVNRLEARVPGDHEAGGPRRLGLPVDMIVSSSCVHFFLFNTLSIVPFFLTAFISSFATISHFPYCTCLYPRNHVDAALHT
jgi:hypothetical protein